MIHNSLTKSFPLLQLRDNITLLSPGQAFAVLLDGVTVVRRGLIVTSAGESPSCWLEGSSQSGRSGKHIDLFPVQHGIPQPLMGRASVQRMSDNAFAAFVRLVPRRVTDMLRPSAPKDTPHPVATPETAITIRRDTAIVPSPFESVGTSGSDSVVKRIGGKLVRVKRERAPCSPPSSLDRRPCVPARMGRPPKPIRSHVTAQDPAEISDAVRCALDILDDRLKDFSRTLEAIIEKVADLSKDFNDFEQILVQKGFF